MKTPAKMAIIHWENWRNLSSILEQSVLETQLTKHSVRSALHFRLIGPTGRRGRRRRRFRDHLGVFAQRGSPAPLVLPASIRRPLLGDHRQLGRRGHVRRSGGHGGLARGRPRVYFGRACAARDEDPWLPVTGRHQQHLRRGATHSPQVVALTRRRHLPAALPAAAPRREPQSACSRGQRSVAPQCASATEPDLLFHVGSSFILFHSQTKPPRCCFFPLIHCFG